MFSGIVNAIGTMAQVDAINKGCRLRVLTGALPLDMVRIGDSISVNGVCLTAVACDAERFSADVSLETLSKTTLGDLQVGDGVNLENALRMGGSLDGHLVTGHVDGVGRVESLVESARSIVLRIRTEGALAPYIARKGAVTVDGVSLTVNDVGNTNFQVNIIPHTREITVIAGYQPGTAVNIEVDIIARYVERLARCGYEAAEINLELLKSHGYTSQE